MQTAFATTSRPVSHFAPRVVETCRGTAHPERMKREHDRTRDLVLQSLLLHPEPALAGARR